MGTCDFGSFPCDLGRFVMGTRGMKKGYFNVMDTCDFDSFVRDTRHDKMQNFM